MSIKSTAKQLEERYELAANLLAKGTPRQDVVDCLTVTYKVSPQQARKYVREAKSLILREIQEDNNTVAFEFFSCLDDLKRDRLDAREAGNYSAAVGATKARVKLLEHLPSIDPGGCWDAEIQSRYHEWVEERLGPKKGKIPKQRLSSLDSLDYERDDIPF